SGCGDPPLGWSAMTTPTTKSPREVFAPMREIVAFALLGVTALGLLSALLDLIPSTELPPFVSYLDYVATMRGRGFTAWPVVVSSVLAVVLVAYLGEPSARAKLVTVLATALQGVVVLFAFVFDVLLPLFPLLSDDVLFGVQRTLG